MNSSTYLWISNSNSVSNTAFGEGVGGTKSMYADVAEEGD